MNKTLIVGGLILALLVPSAFAGSQRSQASVLVSSFEVTRRRASTSSFVAEADALAGSER
jgi:hypothetical protein